MNIKQQIENRKTEIRNQYLTTKKIKIPKDSKLGTEFILHKMRAKLQDEDIDENIELREVEIEVCVFCGDDRVICACDKYESKRNKDKELSSLLREFKIAKRMEVSGFSKRQLNYSFDSFVVTKENAAMINKIKYYLDNWDENKAEGYGLIFSGSPGTGKTMLVTSVVKEIMRIDNSNLKIKVGSIMRMLYDIKENFDDESAIIKEFSNYDLLVLDDLGKEHFSSWSKQVIYLIVNERYENMKPTFITTNCSAEELSEKIDEATISRFFEMGMSVKFGKAQDYRKVISKSRNMEIEKNIRKN